MEETLAGRADRIKAYAIAMDLESRFVAPSLIARLVTGLEKAGLRGTSPDGGTQR